MLKIKDLEVEVDNKVILKSIDLNIEDGEIHVILGPNGNGKSTLLETIMGNSNYQVNNGSITYNNTNILDLETYKRAHLGIFLGLQNPREIEGVTNITYLKTLLSSNNKEINTFLFYKKIEALKEELKLPADYAKRYLNVGFSGGEKKKNEILQMSLLEPKFIMLDEIDSGVDMDSVKVIFDKINEYHKKEKPSILIVTHNLKTLELLDVDYIHILKDGSITESGNKDLIKKIERFGFGETSGN